MLRISILGLGLIGGSLGLALKAAKLSNVEIVGYDRNNGTMLKARRLGAVDKTAYNPRRAVDEAGLVIIATPVFAIREVMEEIRDFLPEGCTVTDTGSTKAAVMRWERELLPAQVSFVGGHPIAGKEQAGIDAAEATLFKGKPYCLIPSPQAREEAVRMVRGLISTVGGRAVFIDAEEHDQYAAAVSHMPLVLSVAFFTLMRNSAAWGDLARLAGPGFRDMSRLASSDPTMSHDIFLTNREAVLHWLNRLVGELSQWRELLQEGREEDLYRGLVKAQMDRDVYVSRGTEEPGGVEVPGIGDQIAGFIMGERLAERTKDLTRILTGEPLRDDRQQPRKR